MALQLGRPCTIHLRDYRTAMLIDADIPQNPSQTLFRRPADDEGPPRSSSQIVKYVLAQKIQDLMASHAFDSNTTNYALIIQAHREVNDLISTLSPCLQMSSPDMSWDIVRPDVVLDRSQIAVIINSVLLSFHRPHIKKHRESLDAAIDAAINVLQYSQIMFERLPKHRHKTFTLIFYTIDAGVLAAALAATLRDNDDRKGRILQQLYIAISRLTVLGERNTAAIAGEKALSKCVQKFGMKLETPTHDTLNVELPSTDHQNNVVSEARLDDHLDNSRAAALYYQEGPQNDLSIDDWDFLPTFDSPDDVLTAITVDNGFTSTWLEQGLESLSSWE